MITIAGRGPKGTDLKITCPMCHDTRSLVVPTEGFEAWERGRLIQDAFPDLTKEEREALITGYCEPCWAKIFPEEEE